MLQYNRVNIWYLFAGSNVLLCCEFTCYNEFLLGKIGELTKNNGLVRRENKKGKMGSFWGIISSSLFTCSSSHGNSDERALSVMMEQEPRLRWVRVGKKLSQQRRETQEEIVKTYLLSTSYSP